MLTYEALSMEAKERGMPAGKMRGILREYLQVLILKELYRFESNRKFCFTGGTYLRLVHKTKRFSEDLDFNSQKITKTEFETTAKKITTGIKKEGFNVNLNFGHWQNMLVAEFIFPSVEREYGIISRNTKKEGIVIKLDVNIPRWTIEREILLVSGFGQMFTVVCTQKGALFADKIDALLKKNRARHLFDILFMLSQKYPIDMKVLRTLGIKEEPLKAIVNRVEGFSDTELKLQADNLRPFLFDENEAGMIVNAKTIVRQLIESYSRK